MTDIEKDPAAVAELERFDLKWNGPKDFVATPMDDGYWTLWHVATETLTRVAREPGYSSLAQSRKSCINLSITHLDQYRFSHIL